MTKSTVLLAGLSFVAAVTLAPGAQAFCRTTTCEPDKETCEKDEHGCTIDGVPLYWKGGAVSLHVSTAGSPLRDITAEELEDATVAATEAWQDAECAGGKKPALQFGAVTAIDDAVISSEDKDNVVVFRDDVWTAERNAIAKTSVSFYKTSGILIDTDIAINSHDFVISTSATAGEADLQAVLTHEIGHVLGIDHSDVAGATMKAETGGSSTVALRSLEQDDIDALCSVYPPATESSGEDDGGCAVASAAPRRGSGALAWFVAFGIAAVGTWRRYRPSASAGGL